jgi:hypothetical protein
VRLVIPDLVDREVRRLIEACHHQAVTTLREHRAELDALPTRLLADEILDEVVAHAAAGIDRSTATGAPMGRSERTHSRRTGCSEVDVAPWSSPRKNTTPSGGGAVHAAAPVQARRLGIRRVRQATAAAAVAAVAGTGLLTWALAEQATAAQSPTGVPGTEFDDGDGLSGSWSDDHVSPPGQLPGSGGAGPVHASSGGS